MLPILRDVRDHKTTRRGFLGLLGVSAAATAGLAEPAKAQAQAAKDLKGWTAALGDGLYAAKGQAPVTASDIAVEHVGGYSRLRANVNRRGIMAHVIAYKKVTGSGLMRVTHRGGYAFRLPVPAVNGTAQTVEGGLFVWDGHLDHGTAFQWELNPWLTTFGQLSVWTGDAWVAAGVKKPDTAWHTVNYTVTPAKKTVQLVLDGRKLPVPYSTTPKTGWGTGVAARLQAEAISVFPGAHATTAPSHEVHVRNWNWTRN
ncbi:hypothetical protein SAMN05421748_13082 [Paractinoplanes atraurantiacus]|uniref:Concanavalin A-like lectin/glucanases superfamily protein n=1 Tax=Paractinoplanes atraurantiacus TaxID=1036182 RepID=A0A285K220_9ACTN|nr:hypothetical protein SAMN05421748_13082 [Actinoplanes atraurantiacus]